MRPLVSILIPAFNAEKWITETLRSAISQTWEPKEIIVVDDGSTDHTLALARRFESAYIRVVTQKNQGGAAARNKAFSISRGAVIQWLDADDVLDPQKISLQMEAWGRYANPRLLLSSSWGQFMHRYHQAKFTPTALWCDLPPLEWLLVKMAQNLYMPNCTWLVSRELTEKAGPWNTSLSVDDDGEYFCRVLMLSDRTRFVREAKTYYRSSGPQSVSQIGRSDRKLRDQFRSIQMHIAYLRSLEDSEKIRAACITFLQNWFIYFYPDCPKIVEEAGRLAKELGGQLDVPHLSWKYSLIKATFGWNLAKRARLTLPSLRWALVRFVDRVMFGLEQRGEGTLSTRRHKSS